MSSWFLERPKGLTELLKTCVRDSLAIAFREELFGQQAILFPWQISNNGNIENVKNQMS